MRIVSTFVPREPAVCWRAFIAAEMLPAWVPRLRRARIIAVGADGLPAEVHFEFAESLTYSLVYHYALDRLEISWEPRVGKRDAVRGMARFEPEDGGTRMMYGLEEGDGRSEAERAVDDPRALLAAFVAWMRRAPP